MLCQVLWSIVMLLVALLKIIILRVLFRFDYKDSCMIRACLSFWIFFFIMALFFIITVNLPSINYFLRLEH